MAPRLTKVIMGTGKLWPFHFIKGQFQNMASNLEHCGLYNFDAGKCSVQLWQSSQIESKSTQISFTNISVKFNTTSKILMSN